MESESGSGGDKMKNYEKYADEIRGYNDIEFCKDYWRAGEKK